MTQSRAVRSQRTNEPGELARNVGADESLVAAHGRVRDEDDRELVLFALRLEGDESERRFVVRNIEPLPGDAFGGEKVLDSRELTDVPILLEVHKHRRRHTR